MNKTPTASLEPSQPAGAPPPGSQIGLKSGSKLGKYEIVGRLGLGGMALVYKGYDPLLDRFVAIKQIASHLAADPKFMDRFRKEAQILARLADQASVVQIHELIEDARGLFIVMEYVEGQTLDVLMARQKGPMPVQLTLEIIWHLAVGLRAVHEKGIIHRDIKPANVLVGVNHRCKITDFGVAARSGGRTSMTLGTTKYMAPELFSGEEVDGRVDIYSLGCIAFEMLCGADKFGHIFKDVVRDEQAESLRWMKWHTNRELMAPMLNQVNPQVPEVLAKIVAKMMAKDPTHRFASAEHLLEIFKRHFTQAGQLKKATAAAAKRQVQATAAKAAAVERKPEPIPQRAITPAAPEPIPLAPLPSGPKTTHLPKRKLTRRQRMIVLGSVLGAMVVALLVVLAIQGAKTTARGSRAEGIYREARGLIDGGQKEDAAGKRTAGKIGQTVQNYRDAHAKLQSLINDPELRDTKFAQAAPARMVWLEGRIAFLTAAATAKELLGTREPDPDAGQVIVPALRAHYGPEPWKKMVGDLSVDDLCKPDYLRQLYQDRAALKKVYDEQWAKAREAERKMTAQKVLDAKEIAAFSKDLNSEEAFIENVRKAVALMDEGLAKMNPDQFDEASEALGKAQGAKLNEDLASEFGRLVLFRAEYKFLRLLADARGAVGRPEEAERLYREVLAIRDVEEARRFLDSLDTDRRYKDARSKGDAAVAGNRPSEAMRFYKEARKIKPSQELDDLIRKVEARDAYAQGLAALGRPGQETVAEDLLRKAAGLDPSLQSHVDNQLRQLKNKDEFRSSLRNGDAALAAGEVETAIQFWAAAQKKTTDNAEVDRINEKIRQARQSQAMALANDAMAKSQWAEAERRYNAVRRWLRPEDTGTQATIEQKLDEIRVRLTCEDYLAKSAQFLTDGKFKDARDTLKKMVDFTKELREAHKPKPPPPPPNPRMPQRPTVAPTRELPKVAISILEDFEKKADSRIKDIEYAKHLHSGKTDMEQARWETAKLWLEMAQKERDTEEVRRLISEVLVKLEAQKAAQGSPG